MGLQVAVQVQAACECEGGSVLKVVVIKPLTNVVRRLANHGIEHIVNGWPDGVGCQCQAAGALRDLKVQPIVGLKQARAHIEFSGDAAVVQDVEGFTVMGLVAIEQ